MQPLGWWIPSWTPGSEDDPDAGWVSEVKSAADRSTTHDQWSYGTGSDDDGILSPLEAQLDQVRSRSRVRELAEVFTHQREVDAMLDLIPDAFRDLDVKFLEPSAGSGNFLTEILRRKLRMISKESCAAQEQYEHRLLRALASIYGIDISHENVTEARGRLAHVLLEHYQIDANTVEPSQAFLQAAALILDSNVVRADTLTAAETIELCDWRPRSRGRFQRVWSMALVPEDERDIFWAERVQDPEPIHFSEFASPAVTSTSRTHA